MTMFFWARCAAPELAPDIPVAGHHDGIAWGELSVPDDANAWRVPKTSRPVPLLAADAPALMTMACVVFERRRFRGRVGWRWVDMTAFVESGLDAERVAAVLHVAREAS